MTRRRLDTDVPDLQGARVVVAGLGISGRAAARFLLSRGAAVLASERRERDLLGDEAGELEAAGVKIEAGGHIPDTFAAADLVVASPGVPLSSPALAAARGQGVPIWAEVELAARFLRGMLIGVTGSNGKSTVVSLIAHLLQEAGLDGVACGNLGTPLVSLIPEDRAERRYVVELSSFQLEGIDRLRPHVAVITNVSPDHQDRYDSFDAYVAAKARLFRNQGAGDFAVWNADDPRLEPMATHAGGPARLAFSASRPVDEGAFLDEGRLVLQRGARRDPILPAAELAIAGRHNIENALAAALAALLAGAPLDRLPAGLRSFRGLPHRMETVAEIGGVTWLNDSKATNLGATRRVVESLDRPLVLILGGRDKGADFRELRDALPGRARFLVLIGEAREKIAAALGDLLPMAVVETLDEAVVEARRAARPGEAVLLAPACASFDQYRSFEERGEHFRALVRRLAEASDG